MASRYVQREIDSLVEMVCAVERDRDYFDDRVGLLEAAARRLCAELNDHTLAAVEVADCVTNRRVIELRRDELMAVVEERAAEAKEDV